MVQLKNIWHPAELDMWYDPT